MLHDRIALERHDYTATRAERLQNAKHWVLRLNADGPQKPLRQRQEFADALKQCLKMHDAHLAETEQTLIRIHPQHQQRQRQNQQFEGGENFDYHVDRKTGWRYYREPRGNPLAASSSSTSQWQDSQWQSSWSSWQPIIIREMVVISVSWKEFQKIDGECRQYTHKHCTYNAVQSLHKLGMHRTRLAQELHNIFVRLKRICHLVRSCLTHCCSLTCRSPRAHHLPHSLFVPPLHQNMQHNRDNTIYSKNNRYIINLSKISQSTSGAIKNHSAEKTCRVAETRAKHSPHPTHN